MARAPKPPPGWTVYRQDDAPLGYGGKRTVCRIDPEARVIIAWRKAPRDKLAEVLPRAYALIRERWPWTIDNRR
jgi:hypothetical protein